MLGPALTGCGTAPAAQPWPTRPFLLLGEVHDNPLHHQLRADGLRQWLVSGRPAVVLFEQMERSRNGAIRAVLDRAYAQPTSADAAQITAWADELAAAGGLSPEAWGWPLHRPIVEACLAARVPMAGANLAVSEVRAVIRGGLAAAPADVRALIERDTTWSADLQATLERLIDEGHCKALPAARWPAMALAQRVRDACMALALREAARGRCPRSAPPGGVQRPNVRRDLGVPQALQAVGIAGDQIHAVAYLEQGSTDPRETVLYDQIIHTRRQERPDPCEAFRSRPAAAPPAPVRAP
jgi:uncharacterized iron-regulated protein